MSHTIIIDESNGNGLFTMKTSSTSASAVLATSVSTEDLSQSLSEYTDADESMSAPTEFLAEFLSAVMLKDYKKAFKYCKLILQYEPNNAPAKEFYPLIMEKLKEESSSDSDENYNKSSSPEVLDVVSEPEVEVEISEPSLNIESDSEEASSVSESEENNLEASNSNVSSSATSGSDNTTHSYSSLLLEEDDDAPQITSSVKNHPSTDLDLSNGNFKSTSYSDSESPTEPLTQRLVAILRSKCVPGKTT